MAATTQTRKLIQLLLQNMGANYPNANPHAPSSVGQYPKSFRPGILGSANPYTRALDFYGRPDAQTVAHELGHLAGPPDEAYYTPGGRMWEEGLASIFAPQQMNDLMMRMPVPGVQRQRFTPRSYPQYVRNIMPQINTYSRAMHPHFTMRNPGIDAVLNTPAANNLVANLMGASDRNRPRILANAARVARLEQGAPRQPSVRDSRSLHTVTKRRMRREIEATAFMPMPIRGTLPRAGGRGATTTRGDVAAVRRAKRRGLTGLALRGSMY